MDPDLAILDDTSGVVDANRGRIFGLQLGRDRFERPVKTVHPPAQPLHHHVRPQKSDLESLNPLVHWINVSDIAVFHIKDLIFQI